MTRPGPMPSPAANDNDEQEPTPDEIAAFVAVIEAEDRANKIKAALARQAGIDPAEIPF